jgi:putative oxidoreductase
MATRTVSVVSQSVRSQSVNSQSQAEPRESAISPSIVLAGRVLFSFIFLIAGLFHFTHQDIAYAAASGVPMPELLVPASGILAVAGGLSILLGYRARLGAWLLAIFLVPVTLTMHNFWAVKDPMMAQMQMAMFMKNLSMLGGVLLISQFGAGPWSLDAKRESGRE